MGGLLLCETEQQPGFAGLRYRSIPTELATPAPPILAALKFDIKWAACEQVKTRENNPLASFALQN
ncbi:MAG: hypothetical protein HDR57_05670 [Treponema sp.]|nr:hypothetical protein [Treponema sp.]MBD5400102.1 hypothetical protein [Treponema sp.]